MLYEERPDGETEVTGLRLTRAGKEHIARADAYVAALDVPGAQLTLSCFSAVMLASLNKDDIVSARACEVLRNAVHTCSGAKRLVPQEWRKWPLFDNIFRLVGVPVITVQLRYNGWVTELQDTQHMQNLSQVRGLLRNA